MKKIIILVLLTLNSFANLSANEPISTPILLEFQAIKSQQQLQKLSINNLKEQLLNSDKYYALRKNVLDSQEKTVNWWLSVISILLAVFGFFGFFVAKGKIKEFDGLNEEAKNKIKEAKDELNQIKIYKEQAEKHEKTISTIAYNASRNPKVKITNKIYEEIDKSGSRIDKIFAEIHKLIDEHKYEDVIALSNNVITIAEYEKDNKQLSVGYFYLGYFYGQLEKYQQAIEAYRQAIEVEPYYYDAYINIFETRLITGKQFDVDLVQKFTQFDDELAMMAFDMLKTFKNIENGDIDKHWQTEFSHKYTRNNFRDWIWKEIETWIKNKEKESDKTELQSALEFFKSFNQSKK
jgi:tetratricopeptide (TPR) repeat protein